MRYKKFQISNFKGIKSATVDLSSMTGTNVFCLVGLNESGKTTLLEAIHSFSPDFRSGRLVKSTGSTAKDKAEKRVPRHLLASFTGKITVAATVSVNDEDRNLTNEYIDDEDGLTIDTSSIPDELTLTKSDVFKRGDYVESVRYLDFKPMVRTGKQRKFREATPQEAERIWQALWSCTPDIAYYPTFIFDFPERIYVTDRPGAFDRFYSSVFDDILAADGQGYTRRDIIRRIRNDKYKISWLEFFSKWMGEDDKGKVQQIIDRASATVTKIVFGRWNKIFGENIAGKEISIGFDVEEGRVLSEDRKTYNSSSDHDIYIWFEIKDGTRRFRVNDRSLGFRWFFAFLLFTQFRVSRKSERSVLFLFDEPASNLHAAAQQKLVESFPEIASGNNMMIYTTHSHYMIDPAWLEQTLIVTNRSESPSHSIVNSATLDDESLDIKADTYRKFVNEHPNDTSYFQPIVDRLEIVPSKFDYNLPSVVVEGKSDYYLLSYAAKRLKKSIRLLPGGGAGTFGALIALSAGWGMKFIFLLDGDSAGDIQVDRYVLELGASKNAVAKISDFLSGVKEIEDLLDVEALDKIAGELKLTSKPTKKHISRFFQENLAKDNLMSLGSEFDTRVGTLLAGLEDKLSGAS